MKELEIEKNSFSYYDENKQAWYNTEHVNKFSKLTCNVTLVREDWNYCPICGIEISWKHKQKGNIKCSEKNCLNCNKKMCAICSYDKELPTKYSHWSADDFTRMQMDYKRRRGYNVLKPRDNKFYYWCRAQGLPKKKLAAILGFKGVCTIERRLQGKHVASPEIAVEMARKTGIPAIHFFFTAEVLKKLGVSLKWVISGSK